MKFLHLSDLHLGKRVNEFSMLEDQKYILAQILAIADREQAQGIILAGDIYDKPIPSAEAVQLFDWFLTSLAAKEREIFIISGNHDSVERLSFGAKLLQGEGVYIAPVYRGNLEKIVLTDEYGEVSVYLLPFVKPQTVRHAFRNLHAEDGRQREISEEIARQETVETSLPETYQDAVQFVLERAGVDRKKRNLLVAHQFVTGAGRCDSEEVSVGGLDNVDASVFDDFDYVALGHIHSPQSVLRETVRYCGTPLKYSFSEADQQKSVTVVELLEKGQVEIRTVPLQPLHDMRKIKGTYGEVSARAFQKLPKTDTADREDYVQITLTDEEDIPDGLQKLRIIYPNLMRLEYDNSRTRKNQAVDTAVDVEEKSELELFEEFYELQNNQPVSSEQKDFVRQVIETLKGQ